MAEGCSADARGDENIRIDQDSAPIARRLHIRPSARLKVLFGFTGLVSNMGKRTPFFFLFLLIGYSSIITTARPGTKISVSIAFIISSQQGAFP